MPELFFKIALLINGLKSKMKKILLHVFVLQAASAYSQIDKLKLNPKVLPTPISLLTQILPFIASINSLQIARPIPEPFLSDLPGI